VLSLTHRSAVTPLFLRWVWYGEQR
jgi:hypothetical protein